MPTVYATLQDIETRHPAELITLAADEDTGERDDDRITASLEDASLEVRTILKARYTGDELDSLDEESQQALRLFTIDVALYRIALSFSRQNERIEERYATAIKRLEAIAAGRGALTFEGSSATTDPTTSGEVSPNEVLIDTGERIFTRDTMRDL